MTDQDIDAILEDAQLARREVPVCMRPDLVKEFKECTEKIAKAADEKGDSLSGKGKRQQVGHLQTRLEELREQIRAKTIRFVLEALPKDDYRKLKKKHPPLKGDRGQEAVGYDIESFVNALLPMCLVSPKLSDKQWSAVQRKMSQADWDALQTATHLVNASKVELPFS